jgi:hypothetical protein
VRPHANANSKESFRRVDLFIGFAIGLIFCGKAAEKFMEWCRWREAAGGVPQSPTNSQSCIFLRIGRNFEVNVSLFLRVLIKGNYVILAMGLPVFYYVLTLFVGILSNFGFFASRDSRTGFFDPMPSHLHIVHPTLFPSIWKHRVMLFSIGVHRYF